MIINNMINLTDIKLLNQCNRWLMVRSLRQPMLSEESVLSLALHLLYANRSAHSRTSNQNNLSFLTQPQSLSLEYCFNSFIGSTADFSPNIANIAFTTFL